MDWQAIAAPVFGATTAGLFAWVVAARKHDREIERWRGGIQEEVSTLSAAVTELGRKRSEGDSALHTKVEEVTKEVSDLTGRLRELIGVLKGAKILDMEKG